MNVQELELEDREEFQVQCREYNMEKKIMLSLFTGRLFSVTNIVKTAGD